MTWIYVGLAIVVFAVFRMGSQLSTLGSWLQETKAKQSAMEDDKLHAEEKIDAQFEEINGMLLNVLQTQTRQLTLAEYSPAEKASLLGSKIPAMV